MVNHSQIISRFIRVLLITGLVLPAIIPVGSFVSAQGEMAHFSNPHFINTSEFGVPNPQGMAFSPDANGFFVWETSQSANVISIHEELTGKISFAQNIQNPFGAAFDNHSNSLFIVGAGNAELSKVEVGQDGIPDPSGKAAERFNIASFDLQDAEGISFDPATGRLFVLDASKGQLLIVSPHPLDGFDGASAVRNGKVRRSNLNPLSKSPLRGLAFNPGNGHVYIGSPAEQKIYEVTETGQKVETYDVSGLQLGNPSTMLFAPSRDTTDDPNTLDLFILDGAGAGQTAKMTFSARAVSPQQIASPDGQIVELSLLAATVLPPGTTLLPTTLVRTTDTSTWSNPSPDPSGIDYFPLTGQLLISDSEIEEPVNGNPPVYWHGFNVFKSTLAGSQTGNCTTYTPSAPSLTYNNFTSEPSGLAVNPNNNHIFFSDDDGINDKILEVSLGADGVYCTTDDTVTSTNVGGLYGASDAEDVAYGNNTVFVSSGIDAEVVCIPLGTNGVLGGGDDGPMTHFDTSVLGFDDLEGIDYNPDANTLFIVSTQGNQNYMGETTTDGTLLHAYDLSFMGTTGNLRSDVAFAPSSQNAAVKNIYIVSRGIDNNTDRFENDGKIWEVSLGNPAVSSVVRVNASPTSAASVNYTVTFSKAVTGVNAPDFTLTTTGVSGAAVSGVSGSGTTYTVTVNTGTGNGTIRLDVLNDNSIIDAQNNPLSGGFTSGEVYTILKSAEVQVDIGGGNMGNYDIPLQSSVRPSYAGVDNGPVKVVNTNTLPIVTGLRELYFQNGLATSSFQMMGLPSSQLSDTYWFPSYNNVTLNEQVRFGNVDVVDTNVTITIGATSYGPYLLHPNEQFRVNYAGLDSGPVKVQSSGGVKIIAAIRDAWLQGTAVESFSQLMGLPDSQLSDTYWFPSYNNVTLNEQLRFGNVGAADTNVTVTIGATSFGPYLLHPNEQFRVNYPGVDSGPVKVQSTGGVKIIAAIREAWFQGSAVKSWIQLMGLPGPQLSDTYYLPAYDNVSLNGQLRFGNVGASNTTVTVTIGGVVKGTYPLAPNEQFRVNYAGLDSGPVVIKSSGGVKIIAALRDALTVNNIVESFAQMMGLPGTQVSTTYWLPAYNNVTLDEQLRFGVP